MRLEKWFVSRVSDDTNVIYGRVYDNPKFEDGSWIHTSKVVAMDKDDKWVRTLNSTYELGEKGGLTAGCFDD